MSHYHFIKCCCFQLCNVFRSQNMELDQGLLESLPLGQRHRLVWRMRCDQIQAYYDREHALQKQYGHQPAGTSKPQGHHKKMVHFPLASVIQDAIVRHDNKEVLRLLKEGVDINTPISSGGSLLHLCARHDNVFAAEVLIDHGINVNLQDDDLWTAFHIACACDHPDIVLLLLLVGINVQLQDVNRNFPLDYTIEGTETSYILRKHLEENGVDIGSLHNMKNQMPSTMLSDVRQMISSGESVNLRNTSGITLLHMACASGYKEVVSLLLEGGADPCLTENNYWTPLHLAAKYGQTCIVNQLLKYKANPTVLNCNQDKPSDVAASDQIANILLKAEELWMQHQMSTVVTMHSTYEQEDELTPDVSTPMIKMTPLSVPISKWDSLLEKVHMFSNAAGALTHQPPQDSHLDGAYSSGLGKLEQVKLMPPAPSDDLASLSELTDRSLLYEMQKRFGNDQIYTYIGHILLLINPNKDLPIYSHLVSQLYLSSSGRLCSSLPPHIFSSAERAYHMMLQERRPQCFIISGESGSGKSEACKHILKHLSVRSCPKGFALEPRMKHVNCLLEAFGHARTQVNPNSSRFIKLICLQYCEKRRTLLRAWVNTFALEKSRVICTPPRHQNFNIFYLMAEGLSAEEKSSLCLNNILAHRFLSGKDSGEVTPSATFNTVSRDKLAAMKQSLRALGFNKQEVENIFIVLSALLHLGDLCFLTLTGADSAFPSDLQLLERVAVMLQLNPEDLGSALTSDVQYFNGDFITRHHTVEMSNHYRDLLAKSLYSRLFSFLVNCINCYLQGPEDSIGDPSLEICILDIFGFEEFQINGFEQLCINMMSEKVHQYTNEVLFHQEQQECLQDNITIETLYSLGDQSTMIDFFFQNPEGLLSLLDEESQALRWSEQKFHKRLQNQLDSIRTEELFLSTKDGNGNPPPMDQGPSFTVKHYVSKVTYDLTGSLERNRDGMSQNILFMMKSSENVLIRQLFQSKLTQTGSLMPPVHHQLKLDGAKASLHLQKGPSPSSSTARQGLKKYLELSKLLKKKGTMSVQQRLERCGPVTVSMQLRNSLSEITSKLQSCTPHFVQCVRPNSTGQRDSLDSGLISSQLQYIGVLEMVQMIRYGYPVRLPFTVFLNRYRELVDTMMADKMNLSSVEKCQHILQQCKLQGWQLGKTKVFLRYWQADHLNDRCHQLSRKIVTCQKVVRGWLVRRCVLSKLNSIQTEHAAAVKGESIQHFLQGVEEKSLHTYDSLVLQNATDIARENDRLRSHLTSLLLGERPEPVGKEEDSPKRSVEKSGRANEMVAGRVQRHLRSSSVPTPLAMDNLVHSPNSSIKAALQTVGHTAVEEAIPGGIVLPSPRKQPPPKPRRDPNTRLSASYEAVSAGLSITPKDSPAEGSQTSPSGSPPKQQLSPSDLSNLSKPRPHSDDYSTMKKIPPPKPKRSPNTKLTGSYEEISAPQRPTDMKLACLIRSGLHCLGSMHRASSVDSPHGAAVLSLYSCPYEEDIYIEMVGASRALTMPESDSSQMIEAVYEEMKYFPAEDGPAPPARQDTQEQLTFPLEPKSVSGFTVEHPSCPSKPVLKDGTSCDIPAPFPNLLPHRPPLLVFPPSPVTCSPASDESPLTPLEVKKLPVFETNLNFSSNQEGGGSPLSPQYVRQRADSSPSLTILLPDRSTPPLTPPPVQTPPIVSSLPQAPPPPPYRPPSHFPFPPEPGFLAMTRGHSGSMDTSITNSPLSAGGGAKATFFPAKVGVSSRPEPRRAHSCSSSPLLFNPALGRPLTSPLDELNTLFNSGRSLLRKSTTGRKIRETGFNSNMNLPGQEEQDPTSLSSQLQDKNANNHTHTPSSPSPASFENGNQLTNGSLEDEGHLKSNASSAELHHRHLDSHHTQRAHLNFSPFGAGAAL
ncbi:unconventional myosin-XVI isoform X2 [Denticeps clupeoides]|uniref:Myosin motor domain-containing protein n=1 Tax=Denticeps clupeoides TaxID=299321 RepID=A0AAY4BM57_9TELE|nr:unconventional myosin-XVI isoform X2 [Denticeps clupeoides]